MMINKRLIGAVPESKKYIAGNVALQWCSLCANIAMMSAVTALLAALFAGSMTQSKIVTTAVIALAAVAVRYGCTVGASRMGYLSSKAVKKTLRGAIYDKLLCLGAPYSEQVKTSEVVQVAVEGVDQLETYFGAYLPQFFYAMLAPLTLFVVLCFVSVPAAVVLLVCVPLIPVAIAAVQTWAKKLLSKYWGQYTALGDTFLENLQGLTTLKIYQADAFKNDEMNVEAEKFRKITMRFLRCSSTPSRSWTSSPMAARRSASSWPQRSCARGRSTLRARCSSSCWRRTFSSPCASSARFSILP